MPIFSSIPSNAGGGQIKAHIYANIKSVKVRGELFTGEVEYVNTKAAFEALAAETVETIQKEMSEPTEAKRLGFEDNSYPRRGSYREQKHIKDAIKSKVLSGGAMGMQITVATDHAAAVEFGAGRMAGGRPIHITPKNKRFILIPLELIRSYEQTPKEKGHPEKGHYWRKTTPHGVTHKNEDEASGRVITIGGKKYIYASHTTSPGQKEKRYIRRQLEGQRFVAFRHGLRLAIAKDIQKSEKTMQLNIEIGVALQTT